MSELDPPLRVEDAGFDPSRGELSFRLNRDPRIGVHVPDVIYPRDIRSGRTVYDIESRLLEVLWYVLAASLGAFYAKFQDDGRRLVLGITPPDEINRYGLVSSGGHLMRVLRSLVGWSEGLDYDAWFGRMTDRDSGQYVGITKAFAQVERTIVPEFQRVFIEALSADEIHMGPTA